MIDKNKHYGFMPGCSLSSYNPEAVAMTVAFLNSALPNFSAVLKCCGKPTRDIGQYDLFKKRFIGLEEDMKDVSIEEMILACSNCKSVFDKESSIKALSLWEVLPLIGIPNELKGKAVSSDMVFTIHDSCSARKDESLQDGIRWLLTELGYKYVESKYSKANTRCCGFGGMVNPANPSVAAKVMERRVETLENYPVVVYCGTCRSAMLQAGVKSWHVMDLLWGPVVFASDEPLPDILQEPDKVWHNRYKSKEEMLKQLST